MDVASSHCLISIPFEMANANLFTPQVGARISESESEADLHNEMVNNRFTFLCFSLVFSFCFLYFCFGKIIC